MRLSLVVLLVSLAPATSSAATARPEKLGSLCHYVFGRFGHVPADSPYDTWVQKALYEATGSDLDEDDEDDVRARVKALFTRQIALGRAQSGFYCDHTILGLETTLLGFAVHTGKWDEVADLVRLGIDPNWRDPRTGLTALDDKLARVETELVANERASSPAGRTNFPPRIDAVREYWRLRELGLRHATEQSEPTAPKALCPASAADAPAPGIPYTGELAEKGSGPSPQAIPGVRTVSAWQTACLVNTLERRLVRLLAARDEEGIPNSFGISWAASGDDFEGREQALLEEVAHAVTGGGDGHKERPIVVYCHHEQCLLSYNVLLRLKHAGYTNLFWLRSGLKDWKAKGLPLGPVKPTLESKKK